MTDRPPSWPDAFAIVGMWLAIAGMFFAFVWAIR